MLLIKPELDTNASFEGLHLLWADRIKESETEQTGSVLGCPLDPLDPLDPLEVKAERRMRARKLFTCAYFIVVYCFLTYFLWLNSPLHIFLTSYS